MKLKLLNINTKQQWKFTKVWMIRLRKINRKIFEYFFLPFGTYIYIIIKYAFVYKKKY